MVIAYNFSVHTASLFLYTHAHIGHYRGHRHVLRQGKTMAACNVTHSSIPLIPAHEALCKVALLDAGHYSWYTAVYYRPKLPALYITGNASADMWYCFTFTAMQSINIAWSSLPFQLQPDRDGCALWVSFHDGLLMYGELCLCFRYSFASFVSELAWSTAGEGIELAS